LKKRFEMRAQKWISTKVRALIINELRNQNMSTITFAPEPFKVLSVFCFADSEWSKTSVAHPSLVFSSRPLVNREKTIDIADPELPRFVLLIEKTQVNDGFVVLF